MYCSFVFICTVVWVCKFYGILINLFVCYIFGHFLICHITLTMSIPFQDNSNIIISGCSGSGKTHFLSRLIQFRKNLFITEPTLIIFIYKHWQDIYSDLEKASENIVFMESLPSEEELRTMIEGNPHSLFVCDDMLTEIGNNPFISEVFTRLSHHLRVSTILLLQNLSLPSKFHSTISRNAHVSVLMKSPREAYTIRSLGMQLGDYHNLLQAYRDATRSPYSYLVCDTHPNANQLYRYRTQIFPDEEGVIVYRPNKKV